MAAYNLAKMILYICSIMYDLNIPQAATSVIGEGNDGCMDMANAGKPTSRTRQVDIKYFGLCEWVEGNLLVLEHVPTAQNTADHFTKSLQRTLFYRHTDFIMGKVIPPYSPLFQPGYQPQVPAAAAAKIEGQQSNHERSWSKCILASLTYG